MNKTMRLPLFTRAAITQNSYKEADRTIEVVFATESEVERRTWDDTRYIEILECNDNSVRLDRINAGANLVDTHSTWSIRSVIGVVEKAWVEKKTCKAIIRLSEREEVAGFVQDIISGIIRNVSVGYRIHQTESKEDKETNTITIRVTDWEPAELSMVSVPADYKSGTRSSGQQNESYQEILISNNKRNMDPEEEVTPAATPATETRTATPAAPAPSADTAAVRAAAATAERTRIKNINDAVRVARIDDQEFVEGLIDGGVTIDNARAQIFEKLADAQAPISRTTRVEVTVEAIDKKRAALETAILHRADPSIQLTPEASEFRGLTLLDMARMSVEEAGGNTRGLSRMEIAQASLNVLSGRSVGMNSTSDFPIILGNTVNRSLRAEYEIQERTFTQWASRGSVKDFRETTRVSLGEVGDFNEVKEGAEYQYVTMGEGAEKIKVVKYGQIVAITWEAIINDDLDAFSRIPRKIAAAAARKQSDLVYGILTGNPTMADGKALFHADHANLATGSVIDSTNIGLARKLMRKQKGLSGKDVLNLTPKYLLVGSDQEEAALKYSVSGFVPNEMDKQNVWKGLVTPIVEDRITGNQWFFAADPNRIDTIEYSFLEGHPELFTEQRNGFDVDGLEIKARMVFGAKALDYRGLAKNPGQ